MNPLLSKALLTLPLAICVLSPVSAARPIVRVPGAVYLYDFGQRPEQLPVLRPGTRVFSDPGLTRYIGTLRFPQNVEVSAFLPHAYRISALARQGRVSAWVAPSALGPLPENFLANLTLAAQRREQVEALVARNEAAIGMTEDEVRRSLGRPQSTSRSANALTSRQVWEYVRYRNVPQTIATPGFTRTTQWLPNRGLITTGGTTFHSSTQMARLPVERQRITFENGVVVGIEHKEDHRSVNRPRLVVPPIELRRF